jgi:hypothetical protein
MNRGNVSYLGLVNSDPKVPLDQKLKNTETYLSTVQLVANDEIYYEFNNPQYTNAGSSPGATVLPYNVKFNIDGTVNISASLKHSNVDYGSTNLYVLKNGTRVTKLRTDSETSITLTAKVEINKDDVITFELSSSAQEANSTLTANSLMILAKVVSLSEIGLLEVIE